jgi:hypothetical protein
LNAAVVDIEDLLHAAGNPRSRRGALVSLICSSGEHKEQSTRDPAASETDFDLDRAGRAGAERLTATASASTARVVSR